MLLYLTLIFSFSKPKKDRLNLLTQSVLAPPNHPKTPVKGYRKCFNGVYDIEVGFPGRTYSDELIVESADGSLSVRMLWEMEVARVTKMQMLSVYHNRIQKMLFGSVIN